MALSLWAQFKVKSTFASFSQVATRSGLTGAQVAQRILQANNIHDVDIEAVPGDLTDHYDPEAKVLRLSQPVYGSRSIAAAGVAAHEVGHAIQHANGYAPLKFRSAWVPGGEPGRRHLDVRDHGRPDDGRGGHGDGAEPGEPRHPAVRDHDLFTLVTLPVEFDASRRALATLERGGLMPQEEIAGARRVLSAAALTYVAAFVSSLLTLLYWLVRLGVLGGGRRD